MLDKELIKLLGNNRILLIRITIIQIITLLLTVSASGIICFILYKVVGEKEFIFLYGLIVVLLLIVFKFLLNRKIGKIQSKVGDAIEFRLRNEINEKVLSHHGEFKEYNSQALTQLSVEGIEQLNLYYTVYIPQFFYSMISPLILFVIFCFISRNVALIFLVCVPLIPLSIIAVSKYAKKIFNKYWDKYLSMGGDFLDNIKGLKELKIFLYDKKRSDELDQNADEFRKITMKVLVMQLWSTSIMDFVAFGGAGIGLAISLINLNNGLISSPFMALFLIIVGAEFFLPMRALGSAFHISMNGASAGNKILSILKTEYVKNGFVELNSIETIEFNKVSIKYDDTLVIKDFNMKISENGLYGLIGESGSGKSTILKLFSKEINSYSGNCLINGISLEDVNEQTFFKNLCFISYNSHIFSKTLRENFLLINPYAKDEQMIKALKALKLENFDLDFIFKEDANNVSGGQKQRFILAFYLTREYDFYVMDEVTSNIDVDSEKIIIDIILSISKKKKVLMVSHRLRNLINVREICFLNNDLTQIFGTHSELLNNSKNYKRLFELQDKLEGIIKMNKFSLIFRLLKFVKSFAFIVILAVINGIIGNLFSIGISLFASLGLISIMGYDVNISLLIIVILMISLGCLRGLLRYFEQYSNHYIAFKILAHIRHVIFEKLRKLAPAKLETKEKGAIINQITSDVETLEVFYAHTISPILIALFVNGTIFVFISIYTHFVLGIIALIFYFIIGVFVPLIMYKMSKNDGIKYRELLSKYNARTLDMINGRKDILLTNNKKLFIDESRKNTNELVKYKNINSKRSILIRGYVDLLIYFGAILIIIFGALLSINRLMNPFLIVVALIVYLSSFGPINSLANLPSNLNQTFASAKRLFVLLDEKPIIDEKNNENTFDFDKLEIKNLSFSYKEEATLKDVTLKIKKGESIGIVGESGSGKSTIIKLLMQFYPYKGSIKFNNLELNEIDHNSLHQNVSMFTQNTYLFNDSIKNNIKIAKPDATDQEIIEALKNASAYDFVSKFENGIETIIKEDSTNISLGEKQRIGLARVLLRKPKLLLLDEPTSNIDVFNESIILNTLKSYKKEMTIIMISHKKSTLSIVDKIYKLEDGILYD